MKFCEQNMKFIKDLSLQNYDGMIVHHHRFFNKRSRRVYKAASRN